MVTSDSGPGTFPVGKRTNGCPFCGTPFVTADFVYTGQASKLKVRLLTTDDIHDIFVSINVGLQHRWSATQANSLENLLSFSLPTDVKNRNQGNSNACCQKSCR